MNKKRINHASAQVNTGDAAGVEVMRVISLDTESRAREYISRISLHRPQQNALGRICRHEGRKEGRRCARAWGKPGGDHVPIANIYFSPAVAKRESVCVWGAWNEPVHACGCNLVFPLSWRMGR
jgi:hypothetical protein